MWLLAFLQDALPDAAAGWGDVVAPVGGLAFAAVLIRIAVGQADKRASVAESRESICTTALSAMTTTVTALTDEVRTGSEEELRVLQENNRLARESQTRLDSGLRHLQTIERGLSACVDGLEKLR